MPNEKKVKRGNILTENVVSIVFILVFLAVLLLFLYSKTSSTAILEEKYSKQIALMIDASEPVMTMNLTMQDAVKEAQKNNYPVDKIVTIIGNIVTVRLKDDKGYSYSFFNDVNANANFNSISKTGYYFVITKRT